MNFWEAMYIHGYQKIYQLVTEQQSSEHNILFDCTQATTQPYDNLGLATLHRTGNCQTNQT